MDTSTLQLFGLGSNGSDLDRLTKMKPPESDDNGGFIMTLIEIVDGVEVWETVDGVAYVVDGVVIREERAVTLEAPAGNICCGNNTDHHLSILKVTVGS